jgi:putative oxidoreductase
MFHRSLPEPARDVLVLAARLTVAFVMLAHVWDTFGVKGFTSTADQFGRFGIPLAIAATAFTLVVELIGSILLAVGLFVPYASALMTFVMLGAVFFVHAPHGVFVKNNGWELVGLIAAVCVAIAANGPGRWSLDRVLFDRRTAPAAPAPVDVSSDPAGVPIAPAPASFRPAPAPAADSRPAWDSDPTWNPAPARQAPRWDSEPTTGSWETAPAPAPRWAHEQQPASLWDTGEQQAARPARVPSAYANATPRPPAGAWSEPVWKDPADLAREQEPARPRYADYADPHTSAIDTVAPDRR